jgi:hypothetical protein
MIIIEKLKKIKKQLYFFTETTQTTMQYSTNLFVASTNLCGLYFARNKSFQGQMIIYIPMIASIIYHLAETKHNLPGLPFLKNYASLLLTIDRLCVAGTICSLLYVNKNNIGNLFNTDNLIIALLGFSSLLWSEKDKFPHLFGNLSKTEFAVSHGLWHILAFYGISQNIKE